MLADQRITAVKTTQITVHYPRAVGRNARLGNHGSGFPTTAATVYTDGGHSGWGVVEGRANDLDLIVGRPLSEIFDAEVGVIADEALPLDVALHDLAATILNVPVHEMLGARGERAITCYSGAIYFDDLDPDEAPLGLAAVLGNCAADWAAGFRAFKLKIGRGHRWMEHAEGFARDIEVTRAVREAYPQARILVDANNGYTPVETIRYLRAVEDCGLFWIEEPFHEETDGLRLLRDYIEESGSGVLVADGEYKPIEEDLLRLALEGLVDVLLMDVLSYGLTAWRRIMPLLEEIGVAASPHAWGQPLKTCYAAQMAAGLGNVLTVEGVPGHTEGVESYPLREDGAIVVPQTPGFGLIPTAPNPN